MAGSKPGPLSVEDAYKAASARVERAKKSNAKELDLSLANLKILPPLTGMPHLRSLTVKCTKVSDISALNDLPLLENLNLAQSRLEDLSPISSLKNLEKLVLWDAKATNLASVTGLTRLKVLDCAYTKISDIRPLRNLSELRELDISGTEVSDISALENLVNLESVELSNTSVSNLAPLSRALKLRNLDVSWTKVTDLRPLADLNSLVGKSHFRGLDFRNSPIANNTIQLYAELRNPDRTKMTLAYLRNHPIDELPSQSDSEPPQTIKAPQLIEPLENIPSPVEFDVTSRGQITALQNVENAPFLPLPVSRKDHSDRLEACRTIAGDIIADLLARTYQVRIEYLNGLERYTARLPTNASDGNILLADAAARTLRSLFAAEADFLSPAFGASLKVFLEQHIGLRAFYPEVSRFYLDVQKGRINSPLPVDAVDKFVEGVKQFTPSIFEENVINALEGAAENSSTSIIEIEQPLPQDINQPIPPSDPLGTLEPHRARNFTIAGAVNNLWRVFLTGSKINGALEAWIHAEQSLMPYAAAIIKWLRDFIYYSH